MRSVLEDRLMTCVWVGTAKDGTAVTVELEVLDGEPQRTLMFGETELKLILAIRPASVGGARLFAAGAFHRDGTGYFQTTEPAPLSDAESDAAFDRLLTRLGARAQLQRAKRGLDQC